MSSDLRLETEFRSTSKILNMAIAKDDARSSVGQQAVPTHRNGIRNMISVKAPYFHT